MSLIQLIDFQVLGDERGQLVSLEQHKNVPFEIKRIYYMYGMKSELPRGFHAHKNLEQVAICINGSCTFVLDDGVNREEIILNSPTVGLYIDNNKWREMYNFSSDCILMVLASELYDESDYIRDYDAFLKRLENDS